MARAPFLTLDPYHERLKKFEALDGWTRVTFTSETHPELAPKNNFIRRDVLNWLEERVGCADIRRNVHFANSPTWGYLKLRTIGQDPEIHAFFFEKKNDAMLFKLTWL